MHNAKFLFHLIVLSALHSGLMAQVEQILIDRVQEMPELPTPFQLRDWKAVARGYDAFIFDTEKQGEHLPLIFINESGINYPQNPSFGLFTYVGSFNQTSGEGINVLSALVGASLVGIDKSNQNGHNWILYSQDYFNHANDENIYLNNIGGRSGIDWWYDMMPNVYFYQLYDLYGRIGEADTQFVSVANRMLQAVRQMGGNDAPWSRPNMNYRAWNFVSGTPTEQGVIEPEAAGTYAWLLFHAYLKLKDQEYLKAAEWSLEFLNNLGVNPSYELQLPYGAYIAAKMNSYLGTNYNIEKLVFWIFNRGPLRGWGTIKGKWGGLDVSGLVGEANDLGNDYAFLLNGMQQAATLVPMIRYDKRFANTIGKWMVNLASATRLMYPGFLPASMQDASEWSMQYDPEGVIGYEAMREQMDGLSPFATGDAFKGGWAATNLSLYSSSSVGYLGAVVDTTDVAEILKLDLLATDFYRAPAYPSYLLYNPHSSTRNINLDVGQNPIDIYDAITETFLQSNVSATVSLEIPGQQARSLVFVPSGADLSYELNFLKANGIVIDHMQSQVPYDRPPRIKALALEKYLVEIGDTVTAYLTAVDSESKNVAISWFTNAGEIFGDGEQVRWFPTQTEGNYVLQAFVSDDAGQSDTSQTRVAVVTEVNFAPTIDDLIADDLYLPLEQTVLIRCIASDLNGDPLTYQWTSDGGILQPQDGQATWQSPGVPGIYNVEVVVTDDQGASQSATVQLLTYNYELPEVSDLVAHYPFTGHAEDVSGNDLHGQAVGAKLTEDGEGNSNSAYFFDGNNDHISIDYDEKLNFTQGITVTFWTVPLALPERETFLISHGSWQNRWKISVIPDRNLRWTVKTQNGSIGDLDTKVRLEKDSAYHLVVTYDQKFMSVYLNGRLNNFRSLTGPISMSDIGLEIGQMLPDDQSLNYRGIIDDVQIYNYALAPDSIKQRFSPVSTSLEQKVLRNVFSIFPNPVYDVMFLEFSQPSLFPDSYLAQIVDPSGGIIYEKRQKITGLKNHQIVVSALPPGIYYLKIKDRSNRKISVESFIKI